MAGGNDEPTQQNDRASESSVDNSSSLNTSSDLTSPEFNNHFNDMQNSSLQSSQNLINSWNNVSIDFGDSAGKGSSREQSQAAGGTRAISANAAAASAEKGPDGKVKVPVPQSEPHPSPASQGKFPATDGVKPFQKELGLGGEKGPKDAGGKPADGTAKPADTKPAQPPPRRR